MIYLASPYSHPNPARREARFVHACQATAYLMNQGKIVFSPIAHSHPIATRCQLPLDFGYWERFDREMLTMCDSMIVLMLDGWATSVGVQNEILIMQELKKPIEFMRWIGNEAPQG